MQFIQYAKRGSIIYHPSSAVRRSEYRAASIVFSYLSADLANTYYSCSRCWFVRLALATRNVRSLKPLWGLFVTEQVYLIKPDSFSSRPCLRLLIDPESVHPGNLSVARVINIELASINIDHAGSEVSLHRHTTRLSNRACYRREVFVVSETILNNAEKDERPQMRLTYTIKEACAMIGISRSTLWKAIRTGRLGCYRIGRRVMFSEEHMTGYLKASRKEWQEPFTEVTCS